MSLAAVQSKNIHNLFMGARESTLSAKLNSWISMPSLEEEDRSAIARIISEFIKDPGEGYLCISNIYVNSLPDIFDCEPLPQLIKRLSITYMGRIDLPLSITKLCELKILDLQNSDIEFLPEEIGDLISLECLDISQTNIENLPRGFSQLIALKEFYAHQTPLTSLPEELCRLAQLERLSFYHSQLTHVPASIGELKNLKELDFSYTNVAFLPQEIGLLLHLETLDLEATYLEELPAALGELENLKKLGLAEMPHLNEFPEFLFLLSTEAFIDVNENAFSEEVKEQLLSRISQTDYVGPQLMHLGSARLNYLDHIAQIASQVGDTRDWKFLTKLNSQLLGYLCTWLSRLNETADGSNHQIEFYKATLDSVYRLEQDTEYREIFYSILSHACNSCGDRITLSVLELGVVRRLHALDKTNCVEVATFLKKVWILDLLELRASEKLAQFKNKKEPVDALEIFLAYPIKCKDRFDLPLDVSSMRFLQQSGLREEDFQEAIIDVELKLKNADLFLNYLINNQHWISVLESCFDQEMQVFKRERENASLEENPDWKAIEDRYKTQIKKFTFDQLGRKNFWKE